MDGTLSLLMNSLRSYRSSTRAVLPDNAPLGRALISVTVFPGTQLFL